MLGLIMQTMPAMRKSVDGDDHLDDHTWCEDITVLMNQCVDSSDECTHTTTSVILLQSYEYSG